MAKENDDNLFSASFRQLLTQFHLASRKVPHGGLAGEFNSAQSGNGMDFCDYRPYLPGDDIRAVDWNVYQRNGHLFVRLFQEVRELPLHILLDCSGSMFFENPSRSILARQLTAILCSASMCDHNVTWIRPFAKKVYTPYRAGRGINKLPMVLEFLRELNEKGSGNIAEALNHLSRQRLRRGLTILISDLFDNHSLKHISKALNQFPHELVIIQIARTTDSAPTLSGDVQLVDCETGQVVNQTITPDACKRYREAYQSFQQEWQLMMQRRNVQLLTLYADRPLSDQLEILVHARIVQCSGMESQAI